MGQPPEGLRNVSHDRLLVLPSGMSTQYYSFVTYNRSPGTYRVTFDCDYGIVRDFEIRGNVTLT